MTLPAFELVEPRTLSEALRALHESPGAAPIAGGTNLLVDLRGRRRAEERLIDIGSLEELRGISLETGWVRVGAGTTIAEISRDRRIIEHGAPLASAARTFAAPAIRNRATIGGNLIDASPAADSAPPLLALDAHIELRSIRGKRLLPIDEFFVGLRRTARRPDELLTAVCWPLPAGRSAYRKIGRRKADAISVVSAAVRIVRDEAGVCRTARIALGAVAPIPVRAREAEGALIGHRLSEEAVAAAAGFARETAQPIDDIRGSAGYRRRVVGVVVRRLLEEIGERGNDE